MIGKLESILDRIEKLKIENKDKSQELYKLQKDIIHDYFSKKHIKGELKSLYRENETVYDALLRGTAFIEMFEGLGTVANFEKRIEKIKLNLDNK